MDSLLPSPLPADGPNRDRTGVLLVNLGTPDTTDYWSVRRYLKEFLSDPRVVDLPRVLWWPILNLVILSVRPQVSGRAYDMIWDRETNASPLRIITEAQTTKLSMRLGDDTPVYFAMRYGRPAIGDVLDDMVADGCGRIVLLPLYPQYAGATVGSVVDEVGRWLQRTRWQPSIDIVPPYYAEPRYIKMLKDSVEAVVDTLDWVPDCIVASFHSLPERYCREGDPYYAQSLATARLLAEALDSPFITDPTHLPRRQGKAVPLLPTFQSRFGREEWLKPYTAAVLDALPRMGCRKVAVICPGFAADCVETLEEISIRGRETFMDAGGESYAIIPCMNDGKDGIALMDALLRPYLRR